MKSKILFVIIGIKLCLFSNAQNYYNGPNVYTCRGGIVNSLVPDRELNSYEVDLMNYKLFNPNGVYYYLGMQTSDIISPYTSYYNCHAYAWHLTEGNSNQVWINRGTNDLNLSKYWDSNVGCFVEVSCESFAEKIYYYTGDHSAVKSSIAGKYESMWGAWYVLRHSPNQVPYSSPGNRRYYRKFSISGPSIICSSNTTLTVNNLPPVDSIIWTNSSNLTYVSGQLTNQFVVKASSGGDPLPAAITNYDNYGSSGWVSVRLVGGCGNIVLEKTVWVGLPAYTPIVTGSSTMFCSQSLYVEKYNRNATWSVYGPLQIIGPNYGHKCTVKGTGSGVGWVYATNANECGSFRGEKLVQVNCSSYFVFPNPTNSEVTISLLPDNSINGGFQQDKSIKSIRVVDKLGFTLYTQKFGSDTFETKLDLTRFTTGVYIIKINEGSEEESYTIIKQ